MEIYIKPAMKVMLQGKKTVTVKDVCEVNAPDAQMQTLQAIPLLRLDSEKDKAYSVSALDIVAAIRRKLPDCTVVNMGEMETLVESSPVKKRKNKVWHWSKIVFVTIVLFVGSSTAIMSFHSDAQMPQVFQNYHRIFFGEEKENPLIIDLPYSVGLAVGIIVFFNHFAGKKITMDPTPIEVEMSLYEADVTGAKLDVLDAAKAEGGNNE